MGKIYKGPSCVVCVRHRGSEQALRHLIEDIK